MSTGLDASKRHVSDNLLQHFRVWRFLFVFFLFSSFYAGFVCPSWVFFLSFRSHFAYLLKMQTSVLLRKEKKKNDWLNSCLHGRQ